MSRGIFENVIMKKNFDEWNKVKKELNRSRFSGFVHEREIWWCSLGVNIGHEEDGKNKYFERPVLVVKKWSRETVVVLPLTTKVKRDKYHFVFMHNSVDFAVILSQIRLISTNRLTRRIRKMGNRQFGKIKEALSELLFNKRTPA